MAEGRFVSYLRVSIQKQGASGLGEAAQRKAVEEFLNGGRWTLIREVVEIESGKRNDRPGLAEALRLCQLHDATLLIAKLDRLSRDAHFLLGLQKAGVRFVAVDMPQANELTIGILAVVAEAERKMISARTKAALAAARARGQKFGRRKGEGGVLTDEGRARGKATRLANAHENAQRVASTIAEIRASGVTSLNGIAKALNERHIPTARGHAWTAVQVSRTLDRVAAA